MIGIEGVDHINNLPSEQVLILNVSQIEGEDHEHCSASALKVHVEWFLVLEWLSLSTSKEIMSAFLSF